MVWFEHHGHGSISETQLNIPVVPALPYPGGLVWYIWYGLVYQVSSGMVWRIWYHLVWFGVSGIIWYGLVSIL